MSRKNTIDNFVICLRSNLEEILRPSKRMDNAHEESKIQIQQELRN